MKDQVLERVLARVMDWDPAEVTAHGGDYQVLGRLKYDEYEGFRPGELFLESLSAWLWQFAPDEREIAARFVHTKLVFISRAELDHAIETVYPDVVRPLLIDQVATDLSLERHRVATITSSRRFYELNRKVLVLGLADGARLDRLRRASSLSTEQFYLSHELPDASVVRMQKDLQAAMGGGDDQHLFEHVLLVDDFAGSGFTMLRQADSGGWEGRLARTREQLETLKDKAVVTDPAVTIILYVASHQAVEYLAARLDETGWGWALRVIQPLEASVRVDDPELLGLCERYFDDALFEVLGDHVRKQPGDIAHGFAEGRLPLVLSHNTPNNSVSLLWAETVGRADSKERRALFPRRHRHSAERP